MARPPRLAILVEGHLAPMEAKTAIGLLRYRTDDVVVVLDSTRAGSTAEACVGVGGGIPVVATLDEVIGRGADTLVIGIAPAGGRLPPAWRAMVREALERGMRVQSGLHGFLADDPELAAFAGRIDDVRRPPAGLPVGMRRAAGVDALVVLTVGTDCNVGKMTAALETGRALGTLGVRAAFVATGQTGILIAGSGIAVDAVPADFVAGAAEQMVLEASRDADVVLVEGQGSLHHPAFSGVTLGLLHGACPEALVLCHHHGRERMRIGSERVDDGPAVPSLAEARDACERAASWVRPAAVVAVSINTQGVPEPEARAACAAAERALSVPATDPVRFGAEPIARALDERLASRGRPAAHPTP